MLFVFYVHPSLDGNCYHIMAYPEPISYNYSDSILPDALLTFDDQIWIYIQNYKRNKIPYS